MPREPRAISHSATQNGFVPDPVKNEQHISFVKSWNSFFLSLLQWHAKQVSVNFFMEDRTHAGRARKNQAAEHLRILYVVQV